MRSIPDHQYVLILYGKVHQVFRGSELPEWNENDIDVIDVTDTKPTPGVGWAVSHAPSGFKSFSPSVADVIGFTQIQALSDQLHRAEAAGVLFAPTGVKAPLLFRTDQSSLSRAMTYAYRADLGRSDGHMFLTSDGSPHLLSSEDTESLLAKIAKYTAACLAHYAAIHKKIAAGHDVNVASGWPSNS
jgi:hypothetical protein